MAIRFLFILAITVFMCVTLVGQSEVYSIGSIGGSKLNSEYGVKGNRFQLGFYVGPHGFPRFGTVMTFGRYEPDEELKVGRKSTFYYQGSYYKVIKFVRTTQGKYILHYFDCVELPGKPEKGHVLNLPKSR